MRRLLAACLAFLAAAPLAAEPADVSALFRRGRAEALVGAGYGAFRDHGYLVGALGADYYVRDGLGVGAVGEAWTGSKPQVYGVSPQVRYVFLDSSWTYKPYAGAFYRRTAYSSGIRPLDSGGARAGVVFPAGERAYLAAGLVYEGYFRCDRSVYSSCGNVYPELNLAFGF